MQRVEINAANRIAEALDIICLQEIGTINRLFVDTLQQKGFTIYPGQEVSQETSNERFSAAIAVRKGVFSSIKNISVRTPEQGKAFYGQEVAAIFGTLAESSITIAISSLHSWGFQLYNPQSKSPKNYTQIDLNKMKAADAYTARATNLMLQQKADFSLMAGDLNNNPRNYGQTFRNIKTQGYDVLSSNEATNVNRFDENYKFRAIDFIFPEKKSRWQVQGNTIYTTEITETTEICLLCCLCGLCGIKITK